MFNDNKDNKKDYSFDNESVSDSFFCLEKDAIKDEKLLGMNSTSANSDSEQNKALSIFLCIISFIFPLAGLILGLVFVFDENKELGKSLLIASGIGCGVIAILLSIIINPYKIFADMA